MTIPSCSLFQAGTESVNELLPRDSDVPGWTRNGSASNYKSKDIKKYNREYTALGIEKLAAAEYSSIDDPNITIRLEVIKFGSVLDAYGFYSIKRGPGIFEPAEINEYYTNEVSIFQTGQYVFFSITGNTDKLLKKDLKTFANIPMLYIGENYSHEKLPASLGVLKGSDGYGVLYSRKPYYKFPYLSGITLTQWVSDKDSVELFFAENDSFYDAYEIFKKTTAKDYILLSSDDIYTAFKKDSDGKYSFISVSDRWIFGCWSVTDLNAGKKILSEIRSRIEDYKKK